MRHSKAGDHGLIHKAFMEDESLFHKATDLADRNQCSPGCLALWKRVDSGEDEELLSDRS